jgi:hypothetical protein
VVPDVHIHRPETQFLNINQLKGQIKQDEFHGPEVVENVKFVVATYKVLPHLRGSAESIARSRTITKQNHGTNERDGFAP